ncbi:hypothetical protein M404DRAFT_1005534 [Pisolithus tinctorius Marx 270]|uniref:Uncharacterized protein n=1 Tax=Pisolithus tinctorius Marx 270 TaxID=870435 RepID=A0A0C3IMJ0_PISTI|nr:hypothetical protein M404DRAFT_1005534 [Pisolithus tinctorius Marx 270]
MASHALSEGRAIKPQEQVTKPFEKPDEGEDVVIMIWSRNRPWIDIAANVTDMHRLQVGKPTARVRLC